MGSRRMNLDLPQNRRRSMLLLTVGLLVMVAADAWGQPARSETIGGFESQLPIIPEKNPRDLDSGEVRFADETAREPVASFVDSLDGPDAAFEVMVGRSRILTLKEKISAPDAASVVAVGDPSVADFQLLPNPRLIRVLGLRPGVTDFSVTTAGDETISLELHVSYDLQLIEARLRQMFPAATLRVGQLRDHLVVEGQARNTDQAERIVETLEAYLASIQAATDQQGTTNGGPPAPPADVAGQTTPSFPVNEQGSLAATQAQVTEAQVINLIRIPGVQQVLLQVRIAELNRTAMREIGADVLGVDPSSGNIVGTRIGGAAVSASSLAQVGGLLGRAESDLGNKNTAFGIFPGADFQVIMRLLRQNGLVRVLAEPNLIAMSGHRANFLAGGEFPVPVPQASGAGVAPTVTVNFREYGVRLDFLPFVVDEDRIRLSVTPEVSRIDPNSGTTLVAGGDPVPGLITRRANTTVEMQPGQTLAMAGLLQVDLAGQTSRIPGLGDLPYLGPFFSNTTHERVERELLVLVTPQLVEPLDGCVPLPGDGVEDPTDKELYFQNRYEGATGVGHRSTVQYWHHPRKLISHEKRLMAGDVGFGR